LSICWNQPANFPRPTSNLEPGAAVVDANEALPLFKPNCVLATHMRDHHRPKPFPDWCRMHVKGGAIGFITRLLRYGIKEENVPCTDVVRPNPARMLMVVPYLNVVHPIFSQR
jgi:hypothetical protein